MNTCAISIDFLYRRAKPDLAHRFFITGLQPDSTMASAFLSCEKHVSLCLVLFLGPKNEMNQSWQL